MKFIEYIPSIVLAEALQLLPDGVMAPLILINPP